MKKYIVTLFLLILLTAVGGCDRPPAHRVARVDLDRLLEKSEEASSFQRQLDERGEELEEYYHQLDLGGPETEDQYSVYQEYQQEVDELQDKFDEAVAAAIEEMDGSDRFDAVVTAESAYVVEEDITEEVAEILDDGETSEVNESNDDEGELEDG